MLHKLAVFAIAAIAFALPMSSAQTQEVQLVSFGDDTEFGFAGTNIGWVETGMEETYVIDCDQAAGNCVDSRGVDWPIGTLRNEQIILCDPDYPGVDIEEDNCVTSVEVIIVTTEPLVDISVTIVRSGGEANLLIFDNNKLGAAFASGDGATAGIEDTFQSVSYALGMITPTKTHTLLITSDGCGAGECNGINAIQGIFVDGMSLR